MDKTREAISKVLKQLDSQKVHVSDALNEIMSHVRAESQDVAVFKEALTKWIREEEEAIEDRKSQAEGWDGTPEEAEQVRIEMNYFQELKFEFLDKQFIYKNGVKEVIQHPMFARKRQVPQKVFLYPHEVKEREESNKAIQGDDTCRICGKPIEECGR